MSEEMWHIQIEPGEIKTVTLDQMDDMYRLELISASTLVWPYKEMGWSGVSSVQKVSPDFVP